MVKVSGYLKTHYHGEAIKTGVIHKALQTNLEMVTYDHKRDIDSGYLSKKLFSDVIRLFLKNNPDWVRQGYALTKARLKDETAA